MTLTLPVACKHRVKIMKFMVFDFQTKIIKTNESNDGKTTSQKMKFPVDLITFTKEILNGKVHFLCSNIFHIYDGVYLILL